MSACVVLVRHGETEWNRQRRNQGRFDSPLTERGIAQAHAIGRLLAVLPNAAAARIVASPLAARGGLPRSSASTSTLPRSSASTIGSGNFPLALGTV